MLVRIQVQVLFLDPRSSIGWFIKNPHKQMILCKRVTRLSANRMDDDVLGKGGDSGKDGQQQSEGQPTNSHGLLFTRGEAAGAYGRGVAFDRSDNGAG